MTTGQVGGALRYGIINLGRIIIIIILLIPEQKTTVADEMLKHANADDTSKHETI